MSYDPASDRPYHETVVSLIEWITDDHQVNRMAAFVIATACPANHDNIIVAWRAMLERLGLNANNSDVITALEAKKAAAEAKAEAKRLEDMIPELSRRIADSSLALTAINNLTVVDGLRLIYQVCKKTREELLGFMEEEQVAHVETHLSSVGLGLGMTFGPEISAKLPSGCLI